MAMFRNPEYCAQLNGGLMWLFMVFYCSDWFDLYSCLRYCCLTLISGTWKTDHFSSWGYGGCMVFSCSIFFVLKRLLSYAFAHATQNFYASSQMTQHIKLSHRINDFTIFNWFFGCNAILMISLFSFLSLSLSLLRRAIKCTLVRFYH